MILTASGICKSYESTNALIDVDISFQNGKVHALVGENGAGKSTLFKVLSGYEKMDRGIIKFHDKEINPYLMHAQKDNRIVLVHQELNVIQSIGIAENIFLDRLRDNSKFFGFINRKKLYKEAQIILDELEANINVNSSIDKLDLGQLKIIQIAQALSKNPEVILLDESTAYLDNAEISALMRVIKALKSKGLAIGYISHHLDELQMVADSLTILKDGRKVIYKEVHEITIKEIEELMVGRKNTFEVKTKKNKENQDIIFKAENLKLFKSLDNVSFELKKGEIVGVAGLKGAGGEDLLEIIIGEKQLDSGRMLLEGKEYRPISPYYAYKSGISYLPASRQTEGLIVEFSIKENIIMTNYPKKIMFIDNDAANKITNNFIDFFNIKTNTINELCTYLSGGNMQKVAISKSLSPNPKVLLLNNPTRGIDVGARYEIYLNIKKLVEDGDLAVILVSEDLLELLNLSHRILVFKKGRVTKELDCKLRPTENEIISHMT
jgi:ABC-type sugar transport system ATPase subunit